MQEFSPLSDNDQIKNPQTTSITFGWLLHLRWGAILSQIILVYTVGVFFHISIPVLLVSAILLFEITSNLLFYFLKKKQTRIPEWFFGLIMFIDVILLTVLLSKTGGAMNPFTFLYLLHIVIGAILMRPQLAWSLGLFTILCYASFFFAPDFFPSPNKQVAMEGAVIGGPVCIDVATLSSSTDNQMDLHLQGMLVAFSITTIFIVFFIGRIRKSLEAHNETVNQLKNEKVKSEKLAALATLAAGAAHEFSTPLSTIAVVAGEMIYHGKEDNLSSEMVEDLSLIKNQVAKCKEILDQLSADAGSYRGEAPSSFTNGEIIQDLLKNHSAREQKQITFHCSSKDYKLIGPRQTLTRILKGLLKNAFDASAHGTDPDINATLDCDDSYFIFTVTDRGEGIDKETINLVTEPFFTTKEPGKGMGLGLFLAQSIVDRFGGDLQISSEHGIGTTVTLRLSLAHLGE